MMPARTSLIFAAIVASASSALHAENVPITFEMSEIGTLSDPTGLFSDEEVEQGGSVVQPSIWFSTFPVDGGEVTLSILVDRWCGLSEWSSRKATQVHPVRPCRHRISA